MRESNSSKLPAPRYQLTDRPVKVESKTIGTSMAYRLSTENLSRTGLKLNTGNYKYVPFQVNTLLEMTIDPTLEIFDNPVRCIGKVVRTDGADKHELGIQIVHVDDSDQDDWIRCIARLESKSLLDQRIA